MEIHILQEFKDLIPPLTGEEYRLLEQSCLKDGVRENLILGQWCDQDTGELVTVLADGHNRFEIAENHGLGFDTKTVDFDNKNEAVVWIVNNQLGRRNVSDFVRYELAQIKADILREKGRQKQLETIGDYKHQAESVLSIIDKTDYEKEAPEITTKPVTEKAKKHDTRKEIAKDLGWSTGKIAMADVVKKKADEETKGALRRNEITISKAYNGIKKEEKREEQRAVKEVRQQQPLTKRKYGLIYCDPPWKYDFSNTANRDIENHYPTMSLEQLKSLDIPSDENCVCYMWATAPKLIEAMELMKEWGFDYKTHLSWDKQKIGMGYWFRGQHELLLVGVKGKISPPEPTDRISSVFSEKRTKHSKKPNFFYDYLNKAFPFLLKIELFARGNKEGFDNWGNENL